MAPPIASYREARTDFLAHILVGVGVVVLIYLLPKGSAGQTVRLGCTVVLFGGLIVAAATWRFSGKIARLGDLEANGTDRDLARARDHAIDAVAANIVRSLGALISQ